MQHGKAISSILQILVPDQTVCTIHVKIVWVSKKYVSRLGSTFPAGDDIIPTTWLLQTYQVPNAHFSYNHGPSVALVLGEVDQSVQTPSGALHSQFLVPVDHAEDAEGIHLHRVQDVALGFMDIEIIYTQVQFHKVKHLRWSTAVSDPIYHGKRIRIKRRVGCLWLQIG